MKNRNTIRIAALAAALFWLSTDAWSHCDTMNGPVVQAGRQALELKDVRYALIWVQPADEPAIRSAFEYALAVRELGTKARSLADRYFFETLVRVHRAGEGAPYTGLKDEEARPEPGIASAERALDAGSAKGLALELSTALQREVEASFHNVQSSRNFAPADVNAGRRYVASYVSYIHYVDRLHKAIESAGAGHERQENPHTPTHTTEE